jgi:hypothetical protein
MVAEYKSAAKDADCPRQRTRAPRLAIVGRPAEAFVEVN